MPTIDKVFALRKSTCVLKDAVRGIVWFPAQYDELSRLQNCRNSQSVPCTEAKQTNNMETNFIKT